MTTMNAGSPASSVTEAEAQLQSHLERKVHLKSHATFFTLLKFLTFFIDQSPKWSGFRIGMTCDNKLTTSQTHSSYVE